MVDPPRPSSPMRALSLAAIAALIAGCAGTSAADLAARRVDGELVRLRAQNAALSERVDALEIHGEGLRATALAARAAAAGPDLAPREDDRPALEVVRLVPSGTPKAKSSPIDELRAPSSPEREQLAVSEFARAESLLASKKYDAALNAFGGFVVRFPEHPRATEATLRRGECYLRTGEHARAVEQLEAAIAAAPAAPTAGAALSLLARAHDGAGDRDAARRDRERLRKEFPDHPAAKTLETREGSR